MNTPHQIPIHIILPIIVDVPGARREEAMSTRRSAKQCRREGRLGGEVNTSGVSVVRGGACDQQSNFTTAFFSKELLVSAPRYY